MIWALWLCSTCGELCRLLSSMWVNFIAYKFSFLNCLKYSFASLCSFVPVRPSALSWLVCCLELSATFDLNPPAYVFRLEGIWMLPFGLGFEVSPFDCVQTVCIPVSLVLISGYFICSFRSSLIHWIVLMAMSEMELLQHCWSSTSQTDDSFCWEGVFRHRSTNCVCHIR